MLFTAHKDATIDYNGTKIEEFNKEFDSPFIPFPGGGLNTYCYVIYQGLFGKYKIRQCEVVEVWFTNIWGWRMDNGWTFSSNELDKTVFRYDKEIINETLLYADEVSDENERLKADLKRGFPITEEQYAKIEAWKKEHAKKKHPDIPKKIIPSFLTSNFVYRFYKTHFDHTLGAVYCDECFEKMREELGYISNYDSFNEYYDWLKKLNNEYDAIMNF